MASSFFPSLQDDLVTPPAGASAFFPSMTEVLPAFPSNPSSAAATTTTNHHTSASSSSSSSSAAAAASSSFSSSSHPAIVAPIVKRSAFSSSTSPAASSAAASSSSGPSRQIVQSAHDPNISLVKSAAVEYDTEKCATCPNSEVVVDPHQGVVVCTGCGIVLGSYISEESEWRTFSDRRGEDPNRVGGPEIGLIADAGLATLMGENPSGVNSNLAKLHNKSAMSPHHRQIMDAFRTCSQLCSKLSLPDSVANRASTLFKKIFESRAIRPKGSDTLITACLLWVCKVDNTPITLKEMSGVSDVPKKDIGRCAKEIKGLQYHKMIQASGEEVEKDQKMALINRWGNQLKLGPKYLGIAKEIARKAIEIDHTLASRESGSIGGAVLYIVSHYGPVQNRRPLAKVAQRVSITESTIKDVIEVILKNRVSVIPQEFQTIPIEFK